MQKFQEQCSISDAMKFQGSRFIAEPSYVNIENLTFGRLAFHGMNPEIEKMAEEVRLKVFSFAFHFD